MKKKFIYIIIFLLLLTGCKNKEETEKNDYLTMKSNLLETKKYTKTSDIPCDITVNVDRLNKEQVTYKVTLSHPKENMNKIKAIVVHNYYTEDVFPTIGLFDKKLNLKTNIEGQEDIELKGKIETSDDIDSLNLKLKVLIEYETDNGEKKDIYYKTT